MVLAMKFSVLHHGVREMHTENIMTEAMPIAFLRTVQDDVVPFCSI